MHVIRGRGVNDVWPKALRYMQEAGTRQETRNGAALVVPHPVATVYSHPIERVQLDPIRDAPPFFLLFESLWLLAGRDDARWLDQFVGDFSARFAQEDGRLHGSYGKRWRGWFGEPWAELDQLKVVIELLQANKFDRQAVIQMWDPSNDLGFNHLKDRPCNQSVMLRADRGVLDITVPCRSNDIVWGCYGANVVQFSMLQEYLAARIGIPVGTYTQVSNNWHLYESALKHCQLPSADATVEQPYPGALPLVTSPEDFDRNLHLFLSNPDHGGTYANSFFHHTARPMWRANTFRREKAWEAALIEAAKIGAPDWREACTRWLQRRIK